MLRSVLVFLSFLCGTLALAAPKSTPLRALEVSPSWNNSLGAETRIERSSVWNFEMLLRPWGTHRVEAGSYIGSLPFERTPQLPGFSVSFDLLPAIGSCSMCSASLEAGLVPLQRRGLVPLGWGVRDVRQHLMLLDANLGLFLTPDFTKWGPWENAVGFHVGPLIGVQVSSPLSSEKASWGFLIQPEIRQLVQFNGAWIETLVLSERFSVGQLEKKPFSSFEVGLGIRI